MLFLGISDRVLVRTASCLHSIFSEQFMDTVQSGARVKSITTTWSPDDTHTDTHSLRINNQGKASQLRF